MVLRLNIARAIITNSTITEMVAIRANVEFVAIYGATQPLCSDDICIYADGSRVLYNWAESLGIADDRIGPGTPADPRSGTPYRRSLQVE